MLPIDVQILKYYLLEKPYYYYKSRGYYRTDQYRELNLLLQSELQKKRFNNTKLEDVSFTIFDLETTGFIPELGHEIISIGAIKMKGLQPCESETFYKVIQPLRPVSKRILSLTGLNHSTIKEAPIFIEVFKHFLDFSKDTVLVAHPAKFDMRFLQTMIRRWKLPEFNPHVIDSQVLARWLLPDVDYQLDPLIKHFNITQLDRHHALNDAKMTSKLFENLLRLSIKNGVTTFGELRKLLQLYTNEHGNN